MKQINHETDDTCLECGGKVTTENGHVEDYGITCHFDCLTDELTKTLQGHYYADLGDM